MKSNLRVTRNIGVIFFVLVMSLNAAYAGSLSYLPRDEKLDEVVTPAGYSMVLSGAACSATTDLVTEISRCQRCLDIQQRCPLCCLKNDHSAKKCTVADDPALYDCHVNIGMANVTCTNMPFDGSSCGAVGSCPTTSWLTNCNVTIPGCQRKGCIGDAMPQLSFPDECINNVGLNITTSVMINNTTVNMTGSYSNISTAQWICSRNKNNAAPSMGCNPLTTVCDCTGLPTPLYKIADLGTDCPDGFNHTHCWGYDAKQNLTDCIQGCTDYSNAWEQYFKNTYCCKKNVCCGVQGPCSASEVGYSKYCDEPACDELVNWPECHGGNPALCCFGLTSDQCQIWGQELANCASGGLGGSCRACFQQIDSTFHYDFVAKSNEKLAIIWEVDATPVYLPAAAAPPSTYFFTMVKVFEQGSTIPVHESIVHQRSFIAAFSIFSATIVEQNVLQPGKKYEIRLFYLLPALSGYTLYSTIQQLEFIVLRVRE